MTDQTVFRLGCLLRKLMDFSVGEFRIPFTQKFEGLRSMNFKPAFVNSASVEKLHGANLSKVSSRINLVFLQVNAILFRYATKRNFARLRRTSKLRSSINRGFPFFSFHCDFATTRCIWNVTKQTRSKIQSFSDRNFNRGDLQSGSPLFLLETNHRFTSIFFAGQAGEKAGLALRSQFLIYPRVLRLTVRFLPASRRWMRSC